MTLGPNKQKNMCAIKFFKNFLQFNRFLTTEVIDPNMNCSMAQFSTERFPGFLSENGALGYPGLVHASNFTDSQGRD